MSSVALVRRNSIFSFLAFGVRLAANMVLFIGIARFYGPIAFGQFSLSHVYFSIMLMIADFGYDFYIATEIGRNVRKTEELVRKVMPMKILLSSIAVVLMIAIAFFGQSNRDLRIIMILLALGIPANALATFVAAIFRGNQDIVPEARVAFMQSTILLVLLLIVAALGLPLLVAVGVFVASRFYGLAALWLQARKRFPALRWNFHISRNNETKVLAGIGLTFGLHLLFCALYFQLDTILLDHLRGQEAVALYQSVMKLAALVLVINDVAIAAVIPVLAESFSLDNGRWLRISGVVCKSLHLLGGFFGLLFFLSPGDILVLAYGGAGFARAADVMRIFGVILLIRFGMETYAMMLTTANKQRSRMYVVILATIVNLVANLFAIPAYGIMGAAFVSLGTNTLIALIYVSLVSIQTRRWFPLFDSGQLLIFGGFIIAGGVFWTIGISSLLLVLPLSIVLTAGLTYAGFSKTENELVLSFLRIRTS